MKIVLLLALLGVAVLCFGRWRWGLLAAVVVGFAQDPVRKLLPDRPVIVVTVVAGVVTLALVAALLRGNAAWLRSLSFFYPRIRLPALLFTGLVVAQAIRTIMLYGNRTLAGIGLLGYLMPVIAVVTFYLLARDWADARRWLAVYVACAGLAAGSVLLHYFGVSSTLFDSIALDSVYGVGGRIQMYCGILRGSEFAAFHAATAACLTLAWISGQQRSRALLPASALTAVLLLAVILAGRRKMLAQLALFIVVYLYLEARARGRHGRVLTALTALGLVGGLISVFAVPESGGGGLVPYLARGGSVLEDSLGRITSMTIGSFEGVILNVGFFGAGAGIASQGSQYVAGTSQVIWSNTEGGLGRVLAELGVPGFLVLAALAAASLTALRRVTRFAAQIGRPDSHLVLGAAAILPSNAAVFVSAQQLYGDPFVLVVLGALFGICLGYPPAVALEARAVNARVQSGTRGGAAPGHQPIAASVSLSRGA